MELRELANIIREAGVVGAGGAGFPTYAKLSADADTILLNCAECEPLLTLHRQLLARHPEEILSAFSLIAETVGAKEGIVCIKKEYRETLAAVRAVLGNFPQLRIHELAGVYPMGDEVVMIYEATGRVVRPGGLPIEAGVTVFNVETVWNVYRAVKDGAPVTAKLVTVTGEVNHPVTVRVPIGTPLGDLVEMAGGMRRPDCGLLVGGPMMGRPGKPSDPVTKTTNAILVLPENHLLLMRQKASIPVQLKRAASICCQCQMCTDLCPRHNLGHPIEPHLFMRSAANQDFQSTNAFLNTFFCCGCGVCELYACPQGLSPRTLISEYKSGLRKAGVKAPNVQAAETPEGREYRKVPEHRLAARLDLLRYEDPAPMQAGLQAVPEVRIRLSQHIGAPAKLCVKPGDTVTQGDVIGRAAEGALGVSIHASVCGVVTQADDREVVIRAERR